MLNGVLLVLDELVLPVAAELVSLDINRVVRRVPDKPLNGNVRKVEPRGVVESQHRPRGGGGTLLDVTRDIKLTLALNR